MESRSTSIIKLGMLGTQFGSFSASDSPTQQIMCVHMSWPLWCMCTLQACPNAVQYSEMSRGRMYYGLRHLLSKSTAKPSLLGLCSKLLASVTCCSRSTGGKQGDRVNRHGITVEDKCVFRCVGASAHSLVKVYAVWVHSIRVP